MGDHCLELTAIIVGLRRAIRQRTGRILPPRLPRPKHYSASATAASAKTIRLRHLLRVCAVQMRRSPAVQIPPGNAPARSNRSSDRRVVKAWGLRRGGSRGLGAAPGPRDADFFCEPRRGTCACPIRVLWPVLNQATTCETNLGTKST